MKRHRADDSAGSRVKVGHCQATIREALVERRGLFAFPARDIDSGIHYQAVAD